MRNFRLATLEVHGWLVAFLTLSGSAFAQTQPTPNVPATGTFGRWATIVDVLDTGQDARKTCVASTAFVDSGGYPGTLTLSISNGDALPPDAYPAVTIAIGNKDLPTGKKIAAKFGDAAGQVAAIVYSHDSVAGRLAWMVENKPKTSLALLRAMRRATTLDVVFGKQPVATISMDGFYKAYRSLGMSCGFATADVAP
ncbi:hypothetical protein [Mesorhizobium sp. M0047]|uniref:hypothetical protein n=1 Tax=Mesorhizobium sp. M0047 TaxID=2956859 RepID=UPI003336EC47